MRIPRTPAKIAATAGAVLMCVMGPGLTPALAQDAQAGDITAGIPPAYNGYPAPEFQQPSKNVGAEPGYTLKASAGCVTSFTKASIETYPTGQQWLNLQEAQRYATGKGQVVAVIDTGVNDHNSLSKYSKSADYLDGVATKADCDGHGTEVAGIIAAHVHQNIGFRGVAPDAQIMSVRQSSSVIQRSKDNQGAVGAGTPRTLAYAIRWAADSGATVINMSLAACLPAAQTNFLDEDQKKLQAAIRYAVDRKIVVVAAAGNLQQGQGQSCGDQNSNPDPNAPKWIESPAWFADDVLSVAAIASNDDATQGFQTGQPAGFSIWGPWVSVAAPGTNIISLDPGSPDGLANQTVENNKPQPIQGTSFSAPYVAGLAALVRQKFPNLNAHQVMNRIKMTAQHPAAPGGRNNQVGYGMINPVAALTAVVPGEPDAPPVAKAEQIPSSLGNGASTSLSPMMIALYGTAAGVALLIITLFVVHAVTTSRKRQAAQPSRLRI